MAQTILNNRSPNGATSYSSPIPSPVNPDVLTAYAALTLAVSSGFKGLNVNFGSNTPSSYYTAL
jgi:hypothetical protein